MTDRAGIQTDNGEQNPLRGRAPTTSLSFDNRHEPLSHYDTYRPKKIITSWRRFRRFYRFRFVPYYVGGEVHYAFGHNGQQCLYAFIRKNASSAIAEFLEPKLPSRLAKNSDIMRRLHLGFAAKQRSQLDRCQCRFFIYRDPLERLVSLFNNKFVQNLYQDQSDLESLLINFEHITKTRYVDATFSDFVRVYLQRYFRLFSNRWLLDAHVVPQADHLWPVYYTHVVRFEHLHEDISIVLGKDTADEFFSRKVNSTSTRRYEDPSSDTTVSDLRRRFTETGELPSLRAYISDELEVIIRNLYAIDYELGSIIGVTGEVGREHA